MSARAGAAVDNRFQFGLFFGRNGKLIQRVLKNRQERTATRPRYFSDWHSSEAARIMRILGRKHVIPKFGCPRLFASDAPAS